MNKLLKEFLDSQKFLVISTLSENNKPWIANVYFSCTDSFELLFFSSTKSRHSENIESNHNIAFSTVWFDAKNLGNRKGIQGTGTCKRLDDLQKAKPYFENHYKYYPEWKESINIQSIEDNKIESRPYLVKPDYIKFWNDEEFGNGGTKEYTF